MADSSTGSTASAFQKPKFRSSKFAGTFTRKFAVHSIQVSSNYARIFFQSAWRQGGKCLFLPSAIFDLTTPRAKEIIETTIDREIPDAAWADLDLNQLFTVIRGKNVVLTYKMPESFYESAVIETLSHELDALPDIRVKPDAKVPYYMSLECALKKDTKLLDDLLLKPKAAAKPALKLLQANG